jgi:HSP20 family protein
MDRVFDSFTRGFELAPFRAFDEGLWGGRMPRMDLVETDKDIQVTAELPGMDEKDVEVTLTGDTLTLKGEKKSESEEKGKNVHRMERTHGAFQRTIVLPAEVQADKVEAAFKKGVLTVTLPKTPAAQAGARRIEVKAA